MRKRQTFVFYIFAFYTFSSSLPGNAAANSNQTHLWESEPFCMLGWLCFPKKKDAHQWPESCLGRPGGTQMRTSGDEAQMELNSTLGYQDINAILAVGVGGGGGSHTWRVWNDLACVFCAATGAVARSGPDAPWRDENKRREIYFTSVGKLRCIFNKTAWERMTRM